MKKITLFLILSMVVVLSAEAHKHKHNNKHITISIQSFYDELSPYGDWIYSHDYGYVWRPYFDNPEAFRPYSSGGHWVYTSYGWTWVSDYRWGWATFHYGRWDFDNYLGWLWIPGYEWAPAWVTWGEYDNYWGWAPMGPNIYVQTNWYAPDPWWTFVPRNHFCSHNWNRYIYNRPVHVTHITHITNIYADNDRSRGNRSSWYNGPRVSDVERYSRERVRTMEVVDNQRADNTGIRNNRLNVYRPEVKNDRGESRPSEYRNAEQARTGRKIEQTNARSNDPGANRTRSYMEDSRNSVKQQPANPGNRQTSSEQRGSSNTSKDRNTEMRGGQSTPTRSGSQTDSRNGSVNRESQSDQRMGPQVYPERNSSRSSSESQRGNGNYERGRENEKSKPASDNNRNNNNGYSQPRNSSPDLNKVYSNPSREQGSSSRSSAQPARERKQNETPAANNRGESSERKQAAKEERNQGERHRTAESSERGSTPNNERR